MHPRGRTLLAVLFATFSLAASSPPPSGADPGAASCPNTEIDGFASPYLGHNGNRNIPVATSQQDTHMLESERAMGLRWTFVSVLWPGFEPAGPTDADDDPAGAWAELDRWIIEAERNGLNAYIQPVMSGNGVAPPPWAGYRTPVGYSEEHTWTGPNGESGEHGVFMIPGPPRAPLDMQAAVDFYAKLVRRYKPGGELAEEQGWGPCYGVRVWEVDNEPDAYGFWFGQADDYAELLTRVYAAIKAEDPQAIVLGPAAAEAASDEFLRFLLDARMQRASLEYLLNGEQYAIGPNVDAVSFHVYEQLDGTTIEDTYTRHKAWWDHYADQPGFEYPTDRKYWHTEGGLDFVNFGDDDDPDTMARWVPQFLARGFGVGVDRITLQDLVNDNPEHKIRARAAIHTWIDLLPRPGEMADLSTDTARIYRAGDATWTYVLWATDAATTAHVPVRTAQARVVDKYGDARAVSSADGVVTVALETADGFNEPVYVAEVP